MSRLDTLSIPLVLETVLNHLDNRHVAICRLVNTTWNEAAVKTLQSRVEVIFFSSEQLTKFNQVFSTARMNISVKFHSFHFASALFTQAVEDFAFGALKRLQTELQTFMKLVGAQVTQLRLVVRPILETPCLGDQQHGDSLLSTVMFMEALEMIFNYFPTLQNLKLLFIASSSVSTNSLSFEYYTKLMEKYEGKFLQNLTSAHIDIEIAHQQQQLLPLNELNQQDEIKDELAELKMINLFINSFLSSAPNLQRISCNNNHSPSALLQQSIMQSISSMSFSSSSLKEINVRLGISSPEDILSLCSPKFSNLETLHFDISTTENAEETMAALMELFRRLRCRLQSLNICFYKHSTQHQVYDEPLPLNVLMKNLKLLALEQFEGCINFRKLHALEKLKLEHCRLEGIFKSILSSPSTAYSSLNSLEITEGILDGKEDSVRLFAEVAPCIFPQLIGLTLNKLSCVPLQLIFSHCKRLKSLKIIKCGGVTDSLLCGVRNSLLNFACPVEPLAQNNGKDDSVLQKMVELARSPSQAFTREYPFIGDLKQLQYLTLEGDFSDVAVLYGVIICDKLISLNLRSDMCTWRTPLIMQFALVRLIGASFNGTKLINSD